MKMQEQARTEGDPIGEAAADEAGEATGLPFFRTWRGVYLFVFGSFIVWLGLLWTLSVVFR